MPIDAEFISSENFNLKFKNYLRDFYVYQFKERGIDFKVKGTNKRTDVNKDIIDAIFYSDVKRLQHALLQAEGIQWNKGEVADVQKGKVHSQRKNKRVESVMIESRNTSENPFFSLYRYCSESALYAGTHFSFIDTLLMYFHLGGKICKKEERNLEKEQIQELDLYLKSLTTVIAAEAKRGIPKSWGALSTEDRQKYAVKAIERFMKKQGEFEAFYEYIIFHKKKIVYSDNQFVIVDNQKGYIEKNELFFALQYYNLEIDKKQFSNKMNELSRMGIVKTKKIGQRVFYALSEIYLKDLLGDSEELQVRFAEMVSFFSQISPLGEIGSYMSERLSFEEKHPIYYKHNYLKRALNDYNNIDLLYAIKNKLWTVIEYRNASVDDLQYQKIICYPIEIRESVTDGRQYLIYYHPGFRSVSAMRIEFIDSITLGHMEVSEHFAGDLERAGKLLEYTWGTSFDDFQKGNVKEVLEPHKVRVVVICREDEKFIKSRIQRELRNCAKFCEIEDEEHGSCLEVHAKAASPWEMLQWLRSYTTRIVTVEIDEKEYNGFAEGVVKAYQTYFNPFEKKTEDNIRSNMGKSILQEETDDKFEPVDDLHSLLFNEIFGISQKKLGDMLFAICGQEEITKEYLNELLEEYVAYFSSELFSSNVKVGIEDKKLEQADTFIRAFIEKRGKQLFPIFSMNEDVQIENIKDLLPLTAIEIQWLKNILQHPMAKCFLEEKEIFAISEQLPQMHLFDINQVVLYDQFSDASEFYKKEEYGERARTIFHAIRNQKKLKVRYAAFSGRKLEFLCAPVYVEYSKRDNRMRLYAMEESGRVQTCNLERIVELSVEEETYELPAVQKAVREYVKENERELVLFFDETRGIPERILTEFSCFKKKCVKWGKSRYRMTLYYDREDEKEIIIRLLAYGSNIFVFNDTGNVRHGLIERLENQLELSNCMNLFTEGSE